MHCLSVLVTIANTNLSLFNPSLQREMAMVLDASSYLWSDEYELKVIDIWKRGENGQTLPRSEYHIQKTFALVSLGGVDQVMRSKTKKYMTTKTRALNIIQLLHRETHHGGEHKTFRKIKETYDNISRDLVSKFIKQCEQCCAKGKRKETASGGVVTEGYTCTW